jgi:hypothetical protein
MNWPILFNQVRDIALAGSSISVVGFLGYGIALLKQQIDLQKANIEYLRSLQAPALARDLRDVSQTANELSEKNRQLEEKIKALQAAGAAVGTVEEVKDIASKAYLLGMAQASFEAAAATEKLWELYKSKTGPIEAMLIRLGEEALEGKRPEPTRIGEFSILGSRPEWWKVQNPPTELKKTPTTKEEGTPPDPEPDPDF